MRNRLSFNARRLLAFARKCSGCPQLWEEVLAVLLLENRAPRWIEELTWTMRRVQLIDEKIVDTQDRQQAEN
ncbi:Ets-Related Transcription Factor Elf-4 [Manis pentadactyla]|nr:Ets-Related Transcription Factor Elf-4 [Manis pentadactyla]